MALKATETWRHGFVVDKNTGAIATTYLTTGATDSDGFMRDADGRLVIQNG